MKKIALLLVLFTNLHLLPPQLSITATAYVHEQANMDTSEKPGRMVSVDHIVGGRGGSAHGGGSYHGSFGGGSGSGSSSRGSTGGTGINPLYLGGGAHGRNNHNKHSAAASNHRLFDVGLNVIVVIVLALIILTVV